MFTAAARNERDAPGQVTVPVRHVLVRDPGGDVEHDDRALALDAVERESAQRITRSARPRKSSLTGDATHGRRQCGGCGEGSGAH